MTRRKGLDELWGKPVRAVAVSPTSLSGIVRETMKDLGDPNAKAKVVKARAIELHPNWRKEIEANKHWSSLVTQNREKAAEEMGEERLIQTGGGGRGTPLTLDDFSVAKTFAEEYCGGDMALAAEIVEWLKKANLTRVAKALKVWSDLTNRLGSLKGAEETITAMQELVR